MTEFVKFLLTKFIELDWEWNHWTPKAIIWEMHQVDEGKFKSFRDRTKTFIIDVERLSDDNVEVMLVVYDDNGNPSDEHRFAFYNDEYTKLMDTLDSLVKMCDNPGIARQELTQ